MTNCPQKFLAIGVAAGVKKTGNLDVALIVSENPCTAAAVYTKNLVQAAPVLVTKKHIDGHPRTMRAIVINSGNANAVTGEKGMQDALDMARAVATQINCKPEEVVVMSTGVIGVPLPIEKVTAGIADAKKNLKNLNWNAAAEAIMTTDTRPKTAEASGEGFSLRGMAKGAGMIHPNMATMLGIVVCDAAVDEKTLQKVLSKVTERTFNSISVDGDTSTNDMLVVLCNGASGVSPEESVFEKLLETVCLDLAKQIVRDAEGASKLISLTVTGARNETEARQVGRTVATSLLFKTAIYGKDANWGRVLAAAGRAGVVFDPAAVTLKFGNLELLKKGTPVHFSEQEALQILSQSEIPVNLDLGITGATAHATVWTCDLTHRYIDVNANYRT